MWLQYIPFSDNIKKRACRYLIQRYLGQFLEEKLTLDQLTVDLYNGTGSVLDVSLDVQALNELGEQQNIPFEFIDGYISEMSVSIPWTTLLKDSSYVEVSGLAFTIQPKKRVEKGTSMFESMWSSMTSSLQMAAECMKQSVPEDKDVQTMEGLELFAQTIDSILTRVKIKFVNTLIRLEHLPKSSCKGVGMEIRIRQMNYCDEAGIINDPINNEQHFASGFSINKFSFEGVSLYTDEFPAEGRTFSKSLIGSQSADLDEESETKFTLNPIIAAKLNGQQEIKLKIKKTENTPGPNIDLEMNFGTLNVFLSPRQLQLIIELMEGLAVPDMQDSSNVVRYSQKPMEASDFDKVEQQLLQHVHPTYNALRETRGLQDAHGWSTAPLDDSDEEFQPLHRLSTGHYQSDSLCSGTTSLNASFSSTWSSESKSATSGYSNDLLNTISQSSNKNKRKNKTQKVTAEGECGIEDCRFHVRLNSLAVVLLHEDVITQTPDTTQLAQGSVLHMQSIAEDFFNKLGLFAVSGYGYKDFDTAKSVFLDACQLSHIRLLAAPIIIEGNEKKTLNCSNMEVILTAGSVELLECLIEKTVASTQPIIEYVELIHFNKSDIKDGLPINFSLQPDLKVKICKKEKYSIQSHTSTIPFTDIEISLQQCSIEMDITILDRISTVLNPQVLCSRLKNNTQSIPSQTGQTLIGNQPLDKKRDLKIISPFINIKIRFPISDLRPIHDMDRPPWWRRRVRKDLLFVHLLDFKLFTSMDSKFNTCCYEIQSKEVSLLFQEGETDAQILFGRTFSDDKSVLNGHEWPRFVIKTHPNKPVESLDEIMTRGRSNPDSLAQSIIMDTPRNEPSPFSSKKVVHESDTPHTAECEGEELIIPGDKQEMTEFIDAASKNARLHISFFLPQVMLQFPSKHMYEVIYNRLNSDLLMWKTSAPVIDSSGAFPSTPLLSVLSPAFTMCKSAIQYDSDSDLEEDDGVFYSTWESNKKSLHNTINPSEQCNVVVSLTLGKGVFNVFTNIKDSSGNIIPEQKGEIQFNFKDASVFSVTGHKGLSHCNYICVHVNHVSLYHCGLLKEGVTSQRINTFSTKIPSHLEAVIYRTDRGAIIHNNTTPIGTGLNNSLDMLSVSIRSQMNEERVKKVRVACAIRGASLRHRVVPSTRSWFTQLFDFFNVMDYPVTGYDPPHVITELHQHLWDCVVDYRPLYLPLQSILSVGSLSISSNIAARSSCSTLRIIAEDACLFISDKLAPTVELRLDYVCVLDLGLFELSLRMSDDPKIDLRASNNILNIRTCSDSALALTQLITYFASYGDLGESKTNLDEHIQNNEDISEVQNNIINNLSDSTVERVNILMEDAMIDDVKPFRKKNRNREHKPQGVEVFFFPDETIGHLNNETINISPGEFEWADSDSDTDSDFCIVEHEAGCGNMPKGSLPEIRSLCTSPVHLVDNHFSLPVGKADLLKAPKHYPDPLYRYTLREMTIIWHMYGGTDFKPISHSKNNVTFNNESESTPSSPANRRQPNLCTSGIKYSKTCPHEVKLNDRLTSLEMVECCERKKNEKIKWQMRGGVGRQHEVLMELQLNKVRFQHEIYPDNTAQASRQVFLVHEVEIRDRLASSQINKFLYQYSSEARPRQSHANMVVIKAVHLRPDPQLKDQECCLKVSLLPLRLNIDQDSLLFLITFFNEVSGMYENKEVKPMVPVSPKHTHPIMGVDALSSSKSSELIILDECIQTTINTPSINDSVAPIFIRSFVFSPDVPIRLDYEGKHVDMTHGPLAGFLMGMAQLSCSELKLKRLSHRHGFLGFEKLISYIISEWLSDIKKNQLPSLLGGVGPIYSLIQLFQGIRDLFWLPIEQYQRDGRIVRGLQRGANSFTTSTAMAALELTTRIVQAIQSVAETAFDMVSPGPSVKKRKHKKGSNRNKLSQPADIREGVSNAIMLVREGLGETAQTLVRVASSEHEQKGAVGAVGGVLRQIPPTVVAPFIVASAATSNLLGGVRSQLVPDARREATLKWRSQD
uniref:Autophagy-related protein 2 n=1 Tax=Clastoptera arizonana TaxID=38151 RepID=A0A1B6D799_9HEMI